MSPMPLSQQTLTILLCIAATMGTRFLPFLVFSSKKPTPKFIQYLGRALPSAIFGMLVVYCLRSVTVDIALPQAIGVLVTALLHLWKRQLLLSIAGGTVVYMLLVQCVL